MMQMVRSIDNPVEVVELGARVVYEISNEADSIAATVHYNNCPTPEGDLEIGCGFCFYGPVDDIYELFRRRVSDQKFGRRVQLGAPWYF